MSPFPCLHVSEIPQTENGDHGKRQLPFFALNGNWKRKKSICLLQMETENRSLFSLVGK
jgi:hypothetical protein